MFLIDQYDEQTSRIRQGMTITGDDDLDGLASLNSFEEYNRLRNERYTIEIEQAVHFLEIQRVEGEINIDIEQPIVAPTLTRSLGEDFLLQL